MKISTEKHAPSYPIVLVNTKIGILRIVNKKSTTSFKFQSHETKAELNKEFKDVGAVEWTPEHEVEMAVESGFSRVHDSDSERWEIWDAGKKPEENK